MKNYLFSFTEYLHRLLFNESIGTDMKKFLSNLSWSILGMGLFSVTMMIINILAGRMIGPEGYGRYNLILSIAQMILIPVIFGLDNASIRMIVKAQSQEERSKIVSSALAFIACGAILLLLCLFFFYFGFQKSLPSQTKIFLSFLFPFSIVLILKTIFDSFIRGLGLFKFQFYLRLIEIFSTTALFVFFFFVLRKAHYGYYLVALMGGILLLVIFYVIKLHTYFIKPDKMVLKRILDYGKILTLGSISGTIFGSLDKLVIAKYLNISQLGIYSAYYTAASFIAINAVQLFLNVFFPSIVNVDQIQAITKKMNKIFLLSFVPMALFFSLIVFLALKIFGPQYELNYIYIISFATLGVLQIIFSVYHSMIIAISKQLFKKYIIFINLFSLFYAAACGLILLLSTLSIQSMVNLLIFYVFGMILIQIKFLNNPNSYLQYPSPTIASSLS